MDIQRKINWKGSTGDDRWRSPVPPGGRRVKVIKYRKILNSWVEMPEIQPPTLQGLINYLKTRPGWDHTLLSFPQEIYDNQINYGPKAYFQIPNQPTAEEFTRLMGEQYIKYRGVVNDSCATPWQEMPEVQPPTLQGLADYLKTCPGWDYTLLSTEHQGWCAHQVSHGPRSLFWIPIPPKAEEFTWIKPKPKPKYEVGDPPPSLSREVTKWLNRPWGHA